MFDNQKIYDAYKNLIGWKPHFDTNEINISNDLQISETGDYYQSKHPALRLDIIQSQLPANETIDYYLTEKTKDSTTEIFNDLITYRQLNEYGKTLLEKSVLLNRYGFKKDVIINQNRFVGFQIRPKAMEGLTALINEIGLQFVGEESFNLYLFHSSKSEPLQTIPVTTSGSGAWDWSTVDLTLSAFLSKEYYGGVFVLGYYQEDIVTNAINYSRFNWDSGTCGACNDPHYSTWKSIRNNFHVYPCYVPMGSYVKGEMFDLEDVLYSNSESFGLNLKFTVKCDLTDFFVENKFVFKNLLAQKVVYKILRDLQYSQESNFINDNLRSLIIRDLEADTETKSIPMPKAYMNELKAVDFNISAINSKCLECNKNGYYPVYGVV